MIAGSWRAKQVLDRQWQTKLVLDWTPFSHLASSDAVSGSHIANRRGCDTRSLQQWFSMCAQSFPRHVAREEAAGLC